jgi:hypothetical protein
VADPDSGETAGEQEMVTDTYEGSDGHDRPVKVWEPMCRDLALALVTARSERFSDWDVDHVVPVAPRVDV